MFSYWQRLKDVLKPELNHTGLIQYLSDLNPQNLVSVRIDALQGIAAWIRLPVKSGSDLHVYSPLETRNLRYKFFLQLLERNEKEASWFYGLIDNFIQRGLAIRLFCLTGLSESNDFTGEFIERIVHKTLPRSHEEEDLAEIFQRIFIEEDAAWFENSSEQIIAPFLAAIKKREISLDSLTLDIHDAILILTSRISAIGTSREIRKRLNEKNLSTSGFITLGQVVLGQTQDKQLILKEISHCRTHLEEVRLNLETTGVSVDIIYQIEKITQLLDRLENLLAITMKSDQQNSNFLTSLLISRLIRDEINRSGIRDFLSDHLHLITRKIVERTGEKADHYIATTKEEAHELFKAGSWAGVLTGFTALLKIFIGMAHLPFLLEGIGFFINYSVSFLLMQRWHLALSSKLPAYTAAALSRKFEEFMKTKELSETLIEVRKIIGSQGLAAFSNLLWVAPIAIILDWLWFLGLGSHIYSPDEALLVISKHELLSSGTIFYSVLTGIFLWASSIASGMFENWLVYRNFPKIIRRSKIFNRMMDKKTLEKWASEFPAIAGAVMGNLSISFLLAAPIVIGKITGLPLDIRHVTLAAGTVTFALNSLEWDILYWPQILSMIVSVLVIGAINFGVSFYFSIKIAALARGVPAKYLKLIYRFSLRRTKPLPSTPSH